MCVTAGTLRLLVVLELSESVAAVLLVFSPGVGTSWYVGTPWPGPEIITTNQIDINQDLGGFWKFATCKNENNFQNNPPEKANK